MFVNSHGHLRLCRHFVQTWIVTIFPWKEILNVKNVFDKIPFFFPSAVSRNFIAQNTLFALRFSFPKKSNLFLFGIVSFQFSTRDLTQWRRGFHSLSLLRRVLSHVMEDTCCPHPDFNPCVIRTPGPGSPMVYGRCKIAFNGSRLLPMQISWPIILCSPPTGALRPLDPEYPFGRQPTAESPSFRELSASSSAEICLRCRDKIRNRRFRRILLNKKFARRWNYSVTNVSLISRHCR